MSCELLSSLTALLSVSPIRLHTASEHIEICFLVELGTNRHSALHREETSTKMQLRIVGEVYTRNTWLPEEVHVDEESRNEQLKLDAPNQDCPVITLAKMAEAASQELTRT